MYKRQAQNAGISTVYQEVNLCPNLSVAENVYIGREPKKGGRIDWKTINTRSKELLKRFDLSIDVTKTLDSYSCLLYTSVFFVNSMATSTTNATIKMGNGNPRI